MIRSMLAMLAAIVAIAATAMSTLPEPDYGAGGGALCGTDMQCTAYCLDHHLGTVDECADPFFKPETDR